MTFKKEKNPVAKAHIICEDEKWLGGEFFLMDFLRGDPMFHSLPLEEMAEKLAEAHVNLHKINPQKVIEKCKTCSISKRYYDGSVYVYEEAEKFDFLKPAIRWMKDNEPSNRQNGLVHGDFHPLNVLVDDGSVSGVLDWTASRICERERDIASTIMHLTIFGSMVAPVYDYDSFFELYLEEYQKRSHIDLEKLNYYKGVVSVAVLEILSHESMAQTVPVEVKELARSLFETYSGISL